MADSYPGYIETDGGNVYGLAPGDTAQQQVNLPFYTGPTGNGVLSTQQAENNMQANPWNGNNPNYAGQPSGQYFGTIQQQATGITTIDTAALSSTSGYDTLRLGNQGYGNSAYSLQAAYAQIGIGQAPPTLGNHSGGGYNNGGRFIRSGPVAPQQAGAPFGLQGLQIT